MKFWKSKATHSYLSVNKIKQAPVNLQGQILFVQQQILDYRARAKAGAGAAILTSSSRSRVKMERLHNTGFENTYQLSMCRILIFLRIIQVPTRNLPSTTLLQYAFKQLRYRYLANLRTYCTTSSTSYCTTTFQLTI